MPFADSNFSSTGSLVASENVKKGLYLFDIAKYIS